MEQTIYEEIIKKVNILKKLDLNFCVFGSGGHKYILNEKLTEEEVSGFEKLNEITLPKEYRDFLIEVGNGGAGPGYEVIGIDINERDCTLKEKFLLENDFRVDEYERDFQCPLYDDDDDDDDDDDAIGEFIECEYKDRCLEWVCEDPKKIEIERYTVGTLKVSYSGCTYYRDLVLNGKCKGQVWSESIGDGILKVEEDFLTFYNGWLDSNLEVFLRTEKLIKNKVSFDEVMKSLENTFLYSDGNKANVIAGILNLDIRVYSNGVSGAEQALQVEEIKKVYDKEIKKKTWKFLKGFN